MSDPRPNRTDAAQANPLVPRQDQRLTHAALTGSRPRVRQSRRTSPHPTESRYKPAVAALLREIGVTVDGPNPWDIQVHDERFYERVLHQGDLALGESYVAGWWDCKRL